MNVGTLPAVLTFAERLAIWCAVVVLLAIAGFQAGRLASGIAHPPVASVAGQGIEMQAFDDAGAIRDAPEAGPVAAVFGVPPDAAEEPPAPAPVVANTDFQLQGITVAGGGRWAMLSADGANMLVRVGDTLAGGEVVAEITPSTVVLDRDGALTMLDFSREGGDEQAAATEARADLMADFNPTHEPEAPRVTTVTPAPAPAPAPEVEVVARPPIPLQRLRRAIYAPNALSNVHFKRARTRDGGIGWELKWIKDSPLVEAAGLERGDVLVSINGHPVADAGALQGLLVGLANLDAIEIAYDRGNRPMRVTIPLVKSR